MATFDSAEYRRVVRRLAGDVRERVDGGMSVRSALYRSVGECVVDLWNHEVSIRVCELSEQDPEIRVVNEVVAADTTDTHAGYEAFVRAMAFSVLSQDVLETVEGTVSVDRASTAPLRDGRADVSTRDPRERSK